MITINKCKEEIKNLFPHSTLVILEVKPPISGETKIDICGELNPMDFFMLLYFNNTWVKENLSDWLPTDYEKYRIDPRRTSFNGKIKVAFTDAGAYRNSCRNTRWFDPKKHEKEIEERKVNVDKIFMMEVFLIFDALISRYEKLLNKENTQVKAKEKHYRYTAVITSESEGQSLDYISENPWEGNLEKTVEFDTIEELFEHDVEGLFYQLFENGSGKRLGYGSVNSDYPYMDIKEFEKGYVNENNRQGQLIIISGFSRAGKDAIADGLKEMSDNYIYSISVTTRQPRPGERNEVDYYFVTPECFTAIENSGGFLESAEYCGNHYGTPAAPVAKALENGRDMVLVLEKEGTMKVKQLCPSAITFFVAAPAADLKKRMKESGMTEEDCKKRIAEIQKEISVIPKYDYLIMNENGKLEKNIELVHGIIKAQKSKTSENLDAIERLKKEYC